MLQLAESQPLTFPSATADTQRVKSALLAVCASIGLTACATTNAVPRPFPTPGAPGTAPDRSPARPRPAAVDGYAVVGTALSLRGVPYREGGADPNGFDCSGLVHYVFAQHGVSVPRAVPELFRAGRAVETAELAPGDLLFFSTTGPGATHVAIAIGGDEFVHAPKSNGTVRVERLSDTYWAARFLGGRRVY